MKQITINGWIHWKKPCGWEKEEAGFSFFTFESYPEGGYVTVTPYSINFEVPDSFDPLAAQISVLEKEKERVTNEFHASVTRIETELSKLKAIEYSPSVASVDAPF